MYNFRNPKYTEDGRIDVEVDHPKFGWLPFTIDPTENPDMEQQALVDGPAPYVPLIPSITEIRAETSVSRYTFCKNLEAAGILKKREAIDAAKGGWPLPMAAFLSFLNVDQAFDAELEWANARTIHRTHPFVLSLGSYLNISDTQVDALFGI